MTSSLPNNAHRAVVLSEHAPADLVSLLKTHGFEVRAAGDPLAPLDPLAPDVALIDPACLSHTGLEHAVWNRIRDLLARLGDIVPALHETVMSQAERGLFKAVLAHTSNHLGRASRILGMDRNTCARKARAFGLVDEPSRGRKPAKNKLGTSRISRHPKRNRKSSR